MSQTTPRAEKLIAQAKASGATSLNLGKCGLTDWPDSLWELTELEELTMSNILWNEEEISWSKELNNDPVNTFSSIPPQLNRLSKLTMLRVGGDWDLEWKILDISALQALPNLKSLDLSWTQVKDISVLKKLPKLQSLGLAKTQVEDISPLQSLSKLQSLALGGTEIEDFSALQNLTNLQSLSLAGTEVEDLSVLQNLTNLQSLKLPGTKVKDLSPLQNLTNLQSLNLEKTLVEDLAPLRKLIENGLSVDMKEFVNGPGIHLRGCPLNSPPPEIVEQGNEAILSYFEQLEQEGVDHIYEAKLLIVGKGGSGKTSLATKLRDPEAPLPDTDDTTRGIAIEPLYFTHQEQRFRMNIWDFGGQEIYKHTHQFFLTKRSLYVLVDDTRQSDQFREDQKAFNDWLQTVELFGQGSPLLIVQNEIGDRSKDLPLAEMRGRYEILKECIPANLKTVRGLDNIRKAIEYHISTLPHVGDAVPKSWKRIREALAEIAKENPHISGEEFWALCETNDIKKRTQQEELSEYFHDLGVFLHFQEDPRLCHTVVLQNEWVTEAVYQVIDSEAVKKNHGRFTLQEAFDIWNQPTYRGKQSELLALMENFELCYKISDSRPESYLAPQLLPVSRPQTYAWDTRENLHLHYQYAYMPKGLISRFMVRMHRYVRELNEAWKSGVVLYQDEQMAEIIEEFGDDQVIKVRVRGPRRRDFLAVIREQFDRLHDSYGGIQVQMLIPCNCEECEGKEKPHFFHERVIHLALKKHQATLQCQRSFDMVSVSSLLDDLSIPEEAIYIDQESRHRSPEKQILDIVEKVVEKEAPKVEKKGFWERINKPLATFISLTVIIGAILTWYFGFRDADRKDAELELKRQQFQQQQDAAQPEAEVD